MKTDAKKLSIEERIRLTMGENCWSNYDLDGKIYKFKVADATVGLRVPTDPENWGGGVIPAVAFPSAQMMANTWNLELVRKMGNAIANECIERNVDVILGPGLNIKRLPTNGRNFEYFSEDPYLSGHMAKSYIEGVQEKHVGTCMKHYCCNNSEYSRKWVSMEVDERTLRELYLEGFRIAAQAKPWSAMCAYNLLNGRRMSENRKMYDILRNEFGFDGMMISDWEAVKNPQATLEQGLPLTMPYEEHLQKQLLELAEEGKLDEKTLTECAQQVIDFAKKCEAEKKLQKSDMSLDARRDVALQMAREGIVLLKNEGVLPLKHGSSCLVTGAPSFHYYSGGGSSEVVPEANYLSLHNALELEGINAQWDESILCTCGHQAMTGYVGATLKKAALADLTILAVGNDNVCEHESYNRAHIKLTADEVKMIHEFAKVSKKLVVAIYAGAAVDMEEWIDEVDAVLWAGYGGQFGNQALAEILTGKVNPSGKLTETFPLRLEDVPAENAYADSTVMVYEERLNVGYRYFNSFEKPVLFPFGYGLSYSKFEYGNMTVDKDGDDYKVSFDVTNVSSVDGAEISQVYVSELVPRVYRPAKELKGFVKTILKAGETKRITVILCQHAFEYYSVADDCWMVNESIFEIAVGSNVCDIELTIRVEIK